MRRRTLLEFDRFRYLKVAALLLALSIAAYALDSPPVAPYGGTWLGYVLGTAAAVLMVFQLWLGVRRRHHRGGGSLASWVSAHVYLGGALLVLASLHSGFQIGWNIHSLAYVLMLGMVFTGLYGLYLYLRIPRLMTTNLGDESFADLLLKIADLDERARERVAQLTGATGDAVIAAIECTKVGGGLFRMLSGRHPDCPTRQALLRLQEPGDDPDATRAAHQRELYSLLLRKESLLLRARRDVAFRARLDFWLFLHAPLAVATFAALVAHVVATLFYR
jgi:hypothetical protein